MQSIEIRQALVRDLPSLLELEQGIIEAERPYNENLIEGKFHYYDLQELIENEKSVVLVAESGGKIVGSGYAQIRPSKSYYDHGDHSYLGFMFVDPAYRGRGINQTIIDGLISWSKEKGITAVYLDVYADNQAAVRAYEKAGFCKSLIEMKLNLS